MIKRLLKLKYILLFFLMIELILMLVVSLNETYERDNFFENKTQLAKAEYETIYWKIKEQSAMIFQEKIDTKEIIDIFKGAYEADDTQRTVIRDKLYKQLLPSYTRLNKLLKLKQLHFHLPNNHSFLRMHRINKFGDDLTGVRQTVEYVNKYKIPIDGFEEGRVYNGFRFVYPLFDEKNNYLGSVEISFSALSFQNTLSNDIRFSQFIYLKKIVTKKVWEDEYKSNYIESGISPLFLRESNWKDDQFTPFKKNIKANLTPNIKEVFHTNLKSKEAYSLSLNVKNNTMILSFLPIKNPVNDKLVAYIIIISKTAYLNRLHFENKFLKLISFLFLISLLIIIYRKHKYDDEIRLQQEILMEHSKMAQMGSMLSNIAHQWKQPLARINSKLIDIPISLTLSKKDEKTLNQHLENIEDSTEYMADTIENFRRYFHPDKQQNYFSINATIEKALSLLNFDENDYVIKLILPQNNNTRVKAYEDELVQVLMVLLVNAQEALISTKTLNPFIKIILKDNVSSVEIIIIDNAGGIDEDIVTQIFHPYFTTKKSSINSDGNGIGLYMAKMIIEGSMHGQLKYKKIAKESHFSIILGGLTDG